MLVKPTLIYGTENEMKEITDFQLKIADPNEKPWIWNTDSLFEFARESNYLIAKCTFRVDGEKAVSICQLSRELVADDSIDVEAFCKAKAQSWVDSNPA